MNKYDNILIQQNKQLRELLNNTRFELYNEIDTLNKFRINIGEPSFPREELFRHMIEKTKQCY
jgi:hypothetical protein